MRVVVLALLLAGCATQQPMLCWMAERADHEKFMYCQPTTLTLPMP